MWFKSPDVLAAWLLAIVLLAVIGVAPLIDSGTRVPHGLIDVAQQRFKIDLSGSAAASVADRHLSADDHYHYEPLTGANNP